MYQKERTSMKTRRILTLLILSIISITLIIYTWMDISRVFRKQQLDTVIIGGADGPTSILLIDSSHNYLLYGITIAFITVTMILSLVYGHKRKKRCQK
ncbi:MAG: hypothetical protein H6Q59_1695 [Firmicutes bacterium]|nr:hypothetical protein [Bacillota bacterium]